MDRQCSECGALHSQIEKTPAGNNYEHWHKINGLYVCLNCYQRLKHHNRRIVFKGKRVYVKDPPRVGVCNLCRAVVPFDCGQTQMHHEKYDDNNVLKYAIEVCVKCHMPTMEALQIYRNRGRA